MSDQIAFLDTNILLRHIMQDHPDHSPRATSLIQELEAGLRSVRCSDTVIFEAAYALEKIYKLPRQIIRSALLGFVDLPAVILPGKSIYFDVFDLYLKYHGLSFADSYHIELARRLTGGALLTFDRDMGRVQGVTRIEP